MTSVSGRPKTKDSVGRFNGERVGCIETGKKGVAGREGGKGGYGYGCLLVNLLSCRFWGGPKYFGNVIFLCPRCMLCWGQVLFLSIDFVTGGEGGGGL